MATQQRSSGRDFNAVLAKRANAVAIALVQGDVIGTSQVEGAEPIILEALTAIAKESYKAGIRRGQSERPRAAAAA